MAFPFTVIAQYFTYTYLQAVLFLPLSGWLVVQATQQFPIISQCKAVHPLGHAEIQPDL